MLSGSPSLHLFNLTFQLFYLFPSVYICMSITQHVVQVRGQLPGVDHLLPLYGSWALLSSDLYTFGGHKFESQHSILCWAILPIHSILFLVDRVFHWTWSLLIWLGRLADWPVSNSPALPCPHCANQAHDCETDIFTLCEMPVGSLRTGVIDGYEPWCVWWETNSGPLHEQ